MCGDCEVGWHCECMREMVGLGYTRPGEVCVSGPPDRADAEELQVLVKC